ncbi:hypothetical protein M9458_006205, partial [Cirrhinus mrigala]
VLEQPRVPAGDPALLPNAQSGVLLWPDAITRTSVCAALGIQQRRLSENGMSSSGSNQLVPYRAQVIFKRHRWHNRDTFDHKGKTKLNKKA